MSTSGTPLVIDSFEPIPVRFAFRLAVAHNLAKRQYTENVVLRICTQNQAEGFGECVPRTYITGETPATVLAALNHAAPKLLGQSFDSTADLLGFLDTFELTSDTAPASAARCSLELALLDLAGRHWNLPVSDMLGLGKASEPLIYSMVIPFMPERMLDQFLGMVAEYRFSHIKIKVDDTNPAQQVKTIRDRLGDNAELRVDTNCAWTRDSAPGHMRALADLGVASVEQPLSADDLEGMALLRGPGLPLVTLDESVYSVRDIERIAETGAADIINIRVSKCGGIVSSMKMIQAAAEKGICVQLGAQVGESSILSAAGAHLAAGTPSFRWLEGCFGGHLLETGLCEQELQFTRGGAFVPPSGPGLGITVDHNLLDAAAADYLDLADTGTEPSGPCAAVNWGRS